MKSPLPAPLTALLLLLPLSLWAQLFGTVRDERGNPLPFATIYLEGSSRGTTTNLEGSYELPLEPGTHRVVFQYVGYRPQVREVRVGGAPLRLDVQLAPEVVSLREVEVRAGAEDPAYEIMRRAIARRRHYRELVRSFACDVYIKGTVKILDAPETILGQEVGDLDGSLDSNRQGIVYLSESEARWFFQQPDRYREIMVSSKVSGDDQGFSFNSASDLNLNLYDEHIPFGRQVLSPLADNAFNYYRFRLEGTIVNDDGSWLYKIHMRPKRPEDPVMQGYLYIVDSLYLVQGLDAFLTGRAMNWEVFDTLYVHQVHVPVRPPEVWRVFSQNYRVRGGVFGFRFEGHFAAVYSNYAIDTTFAPGFFGNELLTVQPEANEKDLTYWDSIRPVPLTHEERVDYVRKDSIARVRRSKPYLDSLDRVNNRLEPLEILLGYTWRNSFKRRSWTYASPLASLQFSTVQGFYGNFDLSFRQNLDAQAHRWWRLNTVLNYGLSEKKLRNAWKFTYHFNQTHFARLELEGGTAVAQFNPEEPISLSQNTFFSLTFRRNHIRLFDKTFARIAYRRELANGLLLRSALEWSRRRPLPTHSGFSYFYRDSRTFADNTPDPLTLPDHALDPNRALVLQLSLRIRPHQKFLRYPDRKYILGSDWPDIWLHYRKGVRGAFSDADFDFLALQIQRKNIGLGLAGFLNLNAEAGFFPNRNAVHFQDFKHFNGNRILLTRQALALEAFFLLPYYRYSTTEPFLRAHFEHHLEGFLLDKIPLLRKTGWQTVLSANYLHTPDADHYLELALGLENLGWKAFRFLRLDYALALRSGQRLEWGLKLGVDLQQ